MLKWIKRKILNSKYFIRALQDPTKFEFFQSKGYHVIPNHYYYPVPDTSKFPPDFFVKKFDWEGIDLYEEEQKKLLTSFIQNYKSEYSKIPFHKTDIPYEYFWDNGGFQCLDAISFYGMIRHFKPKRVIEVGGGNTTMIAAKAVAKNESEQHPCELITVEPYAWEIHRKGIPGWSRLIEKPVQEVDLSLFKSLNENDILFIDTSHIVKIGSDVTYYFMNLLPHIKPGVIIHFHDIFLPEQYPQDWVMKRHLFFTEQYILRAFLSYNDAFKIIFAGRFLQLKFPDLMKDAFDFYRGEVTVAGSFWIQRTK